MSTLRMKMIELLEQDLKCEYLDLCDQNYHEAVSVTEELFPEYYEGFFERMELSAKFYDKALRMKQRGDVEGEMRMLEKAIQGGVDLPVCYERLAILYSKQKNHKRAYEVCQTWFDSVFWKLPQMSTTSLRLLTRLEKLEVRVRAEGER